MSKKFNRLQHKLKSPPESAQTKRKISNNSWHPSPKLKSILAFGIIVIISISIFVALAKDEQKTPISPQKTDDPLPLSSATPEATDDPTPSHNIITDITKAITNIFQPPLGSGIFEGSQTMDSDVWRDVAAYSWRYFAPGVGVESNTGLPKSGVTSPYFTDWDLGVYIQAVIDADNIGLIDKSGQWGSSARLEKVISFLEHRVLNETTGYPYWFYQSYNGANYDYNSDQATSPVNVIDTGRLLVALNNLRSFNSTLAPRINALVVGPGNRSNYTVILGDINNDSFNSRSIYAYYIASGFASFWPSLAGAPDRILSNMYSAGNITVNGVSMPLGEISCEPLFCALFESANNTKLLTLAQQVYLAHEAYYNATSQYRAFSEGSSPSTNWIYEWVVLSDGRIWSVTSGDYSLTSIQPVIYTKIAISFLALQNATFARDMTLYLDTNLPKSTSGFYEGVNESGVQLTNIGIHTNGLIMSAANYALHRS